MKKIINLLIIIIFIGCSVKQKTLFESERLEKKDVESIINQKVDSLSKGFKRETSQNNKIISEKIDKSSTDLEIKFKPQIDSLGSLIPVNYERIIDGKIKESIRTTGASVMFKRNNSTKNSNNQLKEFSSKFTEFENQINLIKEENENLKSKIDSFEKTKEKTKTVIDFSFMFYIMFFLMFLVLIFIFLFFRYFKNKIRVVDKLQNII